MRDELQGMELVDRYLDGGLSASEKHAFEDRLRENAELQERVDEQRALREGMRRITLRPVIGKAYRSYRIRKWGPWGGAALVLCLAAIGGMHLAQQQEHSAHPPNEAPSMMEVVVPDAVGDLPDTTTGPTIQVTTDTVVMILRGSRLIPFHRLPDSSGRIIEIRKRSAIRVQDTSSATLERISDSLRLEQEQRKGPWVPIPEDSLRMMWGDGRPTEIQ